MDVVLAVVAVDDHGQLLLHFVYGSIFGILFTLVLERLIFPAVVPLVRRRRDE